MLHSPRSTGWPILSQRAAGARMRSPAAGCPSASSRVDADASSSRATCPDSRCDRRPRPASPSAALLRLARSSTARRRCPGASRALMSCDHLQHVGFRLRAERLVDEGLAERFAEPVVGLGDAAPPARQRLLLAAERAAEEIEVGVGERLRQQIGRRVQELPAQIGLEVVERRRRRSARSSAFR